MTNYFADQRVRTLGAGALAGLILALLIWRFESDDLANHLPEILLVSVVVAATSYFRVPAERSAARRLLWLTGTVLALLAIPLLLLSLLDR